MASFDIAMQTKEYNGFVYHANFPQEWIENELPETGRECPNCVGEYNERNGYAMWRGVILGYCGNCAVIYEGTRGAGFLCHGVEFCVEGDGSYQSAYDMYLGDIDLANFGDAEAFPEDSMENHEKTKKSLEYGDEQYGDEQYGDEQYGDEQYGDEQYYNAEDTEEKMTEEEIRELHEMQEYLEMQEKYPSLEEEYEVDFQDCMHHNCSAPVLNFHLGHSFCEFHRNKKSDKPNKI